MKKLLIGGLLTLVLSNNSFTMTKEEFLSLNEQVWSKALQELIVCSINTKVLSEFQPEIVGRVKIFLEISNLTGISIEQLQKAYNLAVQKAANEGLKLIIKQLSKTQDTDSDVAFLSGEVPDYILFTYGELIDNYSTANGKSLLKNALKDCLNLKERQTLSKFLENYNCNRLTEVFSEDVKKLVKLKLKRTTTNILKNPSLCNYEELKLIVKNLKKFGFAG
jgi:hypothetical protein